MKEKVRVKELSVNDILRMDNLVLPAFQRNIKWKKQMQQELINSVMDGYPIGVFTLFNKDEKLYIIDGLQRFSTLTIFQNSPKKIFTWQQIKKTAFFDDVYQDVIMENNESKINLALKKWYEADFGKNTFTNFKNEYINECELEEETVEEIFFKMKNIFTNVNLIVPVIIYSGEWDEAAEIFERMNTGSVNLSKYEVYAASWSDQFVEVPDMNKIFLEKKYKELENIIEVPEFETTVFDLMLSVSYEFCEIDGIEKVFPNLKKKVTNSGKIEFTRDELGFEVISTLIGKNPLKIFSVTNKIIEDQGRFAFADLVIKNSEIVKVILSEIIANDYSFNYYYEALFNIYVYKKSFELISNDVVDVETFSKIILELHDYSKKYEWFTNENRQVTFLTNVINAFEDFVSLENCSLEKLSDSFSDFITVNN